MSPKEEAIVTAVVAKVRVLTCAQVARTWFADDPSPIAAAKSNLTRLERAGWLWSTPVEAHPELPLELPLYAWQPGEAEPPFPTLSWKGRSRFSEPAERVLVYLGTKSAAHALGPGTGPPQLKLASVTHDVHLATVYCHYVRTDPGAAERWISEDELAPERVDQILPDAAIRRADGIIERIVEFVGSSYPPTRLRKIHLDCEARGLAYELW